MKTTVYQEIHIAEASLIASLDHSGTIRVMSF